MKILKMSALALVLAAPLVASAAVPTGVEAVFTTVAADFGTILGYAFTLLGVVLGGKVILGMVGQMVRKGARG